MKTHAKTHGLRRFLCGLTALATAALMVPLSAGAVLRPEPVVSDGITLTKEATALDDNLQTDVTLGVQVGSEKEDIAVLFVLDYSTSVSVRDAAADMLEELRSKTNTNIKVGVINYWADADEGSWTTLTSETDTKSLLTATQTGGTNIHAGLLAAQELLNSPEIDGCETYLITISDGLTYLWTDEATEETMSVWYQQGTNGEYSIQNGNSVIEMKYPGAAQGLSTEIPSDRFNALVNGVSEIQTMYDRTSPYFKSYANVTSIDPGNTNDYISFQPTWKDENGYTADSYLIGTEIAIYKSAQVYKSLSAQTDHQIALKMDENHWGQYPYGEQFMDWMIGESDAGSGLVTDNTAQTVFSTILDQIIYTIAGGTVEDIIDDHFTLSGLSSVTLQGTSINYTKAVDQNNPNRANFYSDDPTHPEFSVEYQKDNNGEETLFWTFNEGFSGYVEMSYTLTLKSSAVPTDGNSAEYYTNEHATLTYTSTDGEQNTPIDFPKPTVTIGSEPEQGGDDDEDDNPPIVIPDNPSLTIRKIWENDSASDRPDSITVDIYHDGEYYDSMVISGLRFGNSDTWRDSYDIPARYEDDDWWVVESDVPAYYDSDVEEVRENVFYITNTYEEPVIEEPVSSEPESSEPSSEPSEVIPSGPSEEPSAPSSEPTSEPSEPAEPTLPQTGQTWWPIIILLAGGAVLVAFGAFRTMRGNSRHGR